VSSGGWSRTAADALPWSEAAAPVWALVCHFPSTQRRRRKLVMINGYIDESEDDAVFAMAGFVAPAEEWAKFSDAWDEACAAPPQTKGILKTKEIMRSPPRGAFWGLSDEQRDEKLRLLYSVIDAHVGYSVYSIVHLEPLKRLTAKHEFRKQATNPIAMRYLKLSSGSRKSSCRGYYRRKDRLGV
jgi:hypothetical protein